MFIFGLGLGMFVTSAVGTLALIFESKKNKKNNSEEIHYHITVDEAEELPPVIKSRLKSVENTQEDINKIIDALNTGLPGLDWSELDKFKRDK